MKPAKMFCTKLLSQVKNFIIAQYCLDQNFFNHLSLVKNTERLCMALFISNNPDNASITCRIDFIFNFTSCTLPVPNVPQTK